MEMCSSWLSQGSQGTLALPDCRAGSISEVLVTVTWRVWEGC